MGSYRREQVRQEAAQVRDQLARAFPDQQQREAVLALVDFFMSHTHDVSVSDITHVVSADHVQYEADGRYVFKPEKLSEGHQQCLRRFTSILVGANTVIKDEFMKDVIIVDNTNTRANYMEPYVAVAAAFNVPVEIISLRAPVDVCLSRNDGRAPPSVVREMAEAIETFSMPGHWRDVTMTIIHTGGAAEALAPIAVERAPFTLTADAEGVSVSSKRRLTRDEARDLAVALFEKADESAKLWRQNKKDSTA